MIAVAISPPEMSRRRQNGVMRAWLMDSYDGIDTLRLGEVPDPRPGPGDVLVNVRFAALNPADAFLAQAMYPAKPSLPHILGRDGVGVVVEAHPSVTNVRTGDTVGILRGNAGVETWGTLAEKVVVPAATLVPVPPGWSAEEMAGAPLVFLTAWQGLSQWREPPGPPPKRSVLLVTGASGGVGVASVLLGRSMDLVVLALSRSAEKAATLRDLGADFVFDPDDPQLRERVQAAVAPKKIDLVIDSIGGPLFNQLVSLLGHGGRVSVVGRSGGVVPAFNTASLLFRRVRLGGVAVSDYAPETAQVAWREIVDRLAAIGKRPVVDRVFSFEDVKEAFARLQRGPMGKVIVRIAG
jgi:NADPH2:quinone reductase